MILEMVRAARDAGVGAGPLLFLAALILTWAELRFRAPWISEAARRRNADDRQEAYLRALCDRLNVDDRAVASALASIRGDGPAPLARAPTPQGEALAASGPPAP